MSDDPGIRVRVRALTLTKSSMTVGREYCKRGPLDSGTKIVFGSVSLKCTHFLRYRAPCPKFAESFSVDLVPGWLLLEARAEVEPTFDTHYGLCQLLGY